MKKRYAGGLAIGILALGFFLGQFWDFGGLGTGEGESTGSSESSASTDESNSEADLNNVSTDGGALQNSTLGSSNSSSGTKKSITISIHEDRFRLTSEEDPQTGVDVSLDEVVRKVKAATGGEQGIKLQIMFQKNAQEGALADLHAALADQGVKRDEIREVSGYID